MKPSSVDSISSIADELGIKRLLILAWRDLDDPESGGSEIHAHEIAKRLAESGISVTLRTSTSFATSLRGRGELLLPFYENLELE